MYKVGVNRRFSAIHALNGDFGEETLPHRHDYKVEWIFTASRLDQYGFAVNIAILEDSLKEILGELEGSNLNEREFFKSQQSSLENLARYLQINLSKKLAKSDFNHEFISQEEVKIWENDSAWASYIEEYQ